MLPVKQEVQVLADTCANPLLLGICQELVAIIDPTHILHQNINLVLCLFLAVHHDILTDFCLVLGCYVLTVHIELHTVAAINDTEPFLISIPTSPSSIEQVADILPQLLHLHRIETFDRLSQVWQCLKETNFLTERDIPEFKRLFHQRLHLWILWIMLFQHPLDCIVLIRRIATLIE